MEMDHYTDDNDDEGMTAVRYLPVHRVSCSAGVMQVDQELKSLRSACTMIYSEHPMYGVELLTESDTDIGVYSSMSLFFTKQSPPLDEDCSDGEDGPESGPGDDGNGVNEVLDEGLGDDPPDVFVGVNTVVHQGAQSESVEEPEDTSEYPSSGDVVDKPPVDNLDARDGSESIVDNPPVDNLDARDGNATMVDNPPVDNLDACDGSESMVENPPLDNMDAGDGSESIVDNPPVDNLDAHDGNVSMVDNPPVDNLDARDGNVSMVDNPPVDNLDAGDGSESMVENPPLDNMDACDGSKSMVDNPPVDNLDAREGSESMDVERSIPRQGQVWPLLFPRLDQTQRLAVPTERAGCGASHRCERRSTPALVLEMDPPVWKGNLLLKKISTDVEMHRIAGSGNLATACLVEASDHTTIRINQRVSFDEKNFEQRYIKNDSTATALIAIPSKECNCHYNNMQQYQSFFTGNRMFGAVVCNNIQTLGVSCVLQFFPKTDLTIRYIRKVDPRLALRLYQESYLIIIIEPM